MLQSTRKPEAPKMYFYDADAVEREFGAHGLLELSEIDEPAGGGGSFPFINAVCKHG